MPGLSRTTLSVLAATAAAGLAGTAIAGATNSTSTTTTASPSSTAKQRPAGGPGGGETALTGTTKEKVEAAAIAKVGGTVIRSESDRGGIYEAHVKKADGTEVEVKVNDAFEVTGVQEHGPGGRGGRGGPGGHHADLAAVAKALGVTEAELMSAVDAARPAEGDRGADRAAVIAKALGVQTADVQKVMEANRPERPAHGERPAEGARPDESKLIAALAKALSIDESKVKSAVAAAENAHRAEHDARDTAMYAAVAKALGKDASDVKAAFEANRPARP